MGVARYPAFPLHPPSNATTTTTSHIRMPTSTCDPAYASARPPRNRAQPPVRPSQPPAKPPNAQRPFRIHGENHRGRAFAVVAVPAASRRPGTAGFLGAALLPVCPIAAKPSVAVCDDGNNCTLAWLSPSRAFARHLSALVRARARVGRTTWWIHNGSRSSGSSALLCFCPFCAFHASLLETHARVNGVWGTVPDTVPETVRRTVSDTVSGTVPDTVSDTVRNTVSETVSLVFGR